MNDKYSNMKPTDLYNFPYLHRVALSMQLQDLSLDQMPLSADAYAFVDTCLE
jgi:hypothetical protein